MFTPEIHQREFANAILAHPHYGAAGDLRLSARPGANATARLGVYRNNTYASLTAALLATFPVTAKLVDERFLRYAAAAFIDSGLPDEPRLSRFGSRFPKFLAGLGSLKSMPFVAETARLEWRIAESLEEPALISQPVTVLSWLDEPDGAAIALQPSLRLFASRWPVLKIWSAHQDGVESDFVAERLLRPERAAIWRTGGAIRVVALDAGDSRFLRMLSLGRPLGRAVACAHAIDPMFDLAGALARIFGCGLVTGVSRKAN